MKSSPLHAILPGLPGEGDLPRQFSASGQGTHREGTVVEFHPGGGRSWVGNFQPGGTSFSDVFIDHSSREALVIAGGQGYRVDLLTGELLFEIGGDIESVLEVAGLDGQLLCSSTAFQFVRGEPAWRSRRVSWDGFRNLALHEHELTGDAWMFDDTWHEFSLNVETGEVRGGSYYEV